jgi:light-regulated signal transduction histidine kinase (bacteriophytochrome)
LANHRLSRSNDELQSFAYVAAHDLKSPLRTISAMTELLRRKLEGRLDDDGVQIAAHLQTSAEKMAMLISDLLDYSKAAAVSESASQSVDCSALLAVTVAGLESQIRATGAKVTWDRLPVVQADNRLSGVFQNLIENALKYRNEEPPEIHVSAQRCGDEWVLSVRDNGIGFDMQYAERIFTPFQRLHGAEEYEGNGIGLAICKKTIERFGGTIRAESKLGVGSTFYFSLPANGSPLGGPDGQPGQSSDRSRQRRRVTRGTARQSPQREDKADFLTKHS